MKIILGQGNPGDNYATTRHNVGWMTLDRLANAHGASWTAKPKFFADIAEFTEDDEKVLLVKPTTYYNETGRSARALVDFYKVDPATDVLAIHDDLALPLGTLRTREKGSDGGNNGIKSLNAHLGPNYARLRIGIFSDLRERIDDVDFVLGRFSQAEQELLEPTLQKATAIADAFIAGSFESTSHG